MLFDFPANKDEDKKSAQTCENVEIDQPEFPNGQRSRQSSKHIPCEPNIQRYFYPKPFGEEQDFIAQSIKEIYQCRLANKPLFTWLN